MRRRYTVVIPLVLGVLFPHASRAAVPVQRLTLVNSAGMSGVARFERAVVDQSKVLRRYWRTPVVSFGPGGWPVYVVRRSSPLAAQVPTGDAGVHLGNRGERPYAVIPTPVASVTVDHEIVEMLVDPYGDRYINYALVEPCDPETREGPVDGVELADWVKPGFYRPGSSVRWFDWLRLDRNTA